MAKHEEQKFRFRINLFDAVVILIALAAGAFLLWNRFKPESTPLGPSPEGIRYTIRLQRLVPGTAELMEPGDLLEDNVKNYELGTVVSTTSMPATRVMLDEEEGRYVKAEIPGYYDVDIVVDSTATVTEETVQVGGGYTLRVGEVIYVRGPGYLGSGVVYGIERGE